MSTTNINRVVLTGNLTQDPELRSTADGTAVCTLRVASNSRRKDATTGEWTDTFDGIANAVRTPLVADYVYANYRVVEVAAGRLVAWRPPSSP